jgi:two-component system, LytTR family, response regulator
MSTNYKAIIIDDEPRARKLLAGMIQDTASDIEIVAETEDLPNGIKAIRKLKPDLIFLDIEMPGHSGMELLDFFNEDEINFDIIFTTAYNNYAIQAFKFSAIDYLLKPIELSELSGAIDRFRKKESRENKHSEYASLRENLKPESKSKIAVPTGNAIKFIEPDKILFLKGEGSYTEINFTDNTKLIVSRTLKNFEEFITRENKFFRCHKSYIVNIGFIKEYVKSDGGYLVMNNDQQISISPDKVDEFLRMSDFISR